MEATSTSHAPASVSKKRPLPQDSESHAASPLSSVSEQMSPVMQSSVLASPNHSSITSIGGDQPLPQSKNSPHPRPALSAANPAKRVKMTPAEKEQREREKAEVKARKEEERAQKEELKRAKDEEKRKLAEEREEKKREKELAKLKEAEEKEAKKKEKELAKQKEAEEKEQEKLKREKAQPKLTAFLRKAPQVSSLSAPPAEDVATDSGRFSSPLKVSQTASPQKAPLSDYEKTFLPFQISQGMDWATHNTHLPDEPQREEMLERFDRFLEAQAANPVRRPREWSFDKTPRGYNLPSVRYLMHRLHGSSDEPIDLTDEDTGDAVEDPMKVLVEMNARYIHFETEDVRPPYWGTCTRVTSLARLRTICRNPCQEKVEETDYDHDSEAEWEEPEEGEEILTDGEDDAESDGDDDMAGFLDDEDADAVARSKLQLSGSLEPVSTGLMWADCKGVLRHAADGSAASVFENMRMISLLAPKWAPIDPYKPIGEPAATNQPGSASVAAMNQLRLPLQSMPNGGNLSMFFAGQKSVPVGNLVPQTGGAVPGKRYVQAADMSAFRNAIQGSDMTKTALVEALKKQFPKIPKDSIVNTLNMIAVRAGQKQAEKRWELRPLPS
ncbi:hypothetical protein K402DRAFT_237008 [Aulographum hederae CBS 113979]|uniref:Chromatin assembly factor 1 subunit A n=1 Tax=Aulographum hederae CBS 113979 TaxID=1176131 RepID=A0A6G1GKM9_9PEZI|nr:hypothetical protein K402DRAFT_237008 [Aulographum hederae CBS 113979]